MNFFQLLQQRKWHAVFGYLLFIGMMSTGYYYNLTFVQLGLEDFAATQLNLGADVIARDMALLAICTCLVALGFGWWMEQQCRRQQFKTKIRISFGVVLSQALLTLYLPLITTEAGFMVWVVFSSIALGVGVPAMFSMTIDLIPVRDRGYVAAIVTAIAYFAAEVFSSEWTFEFFRQQFLWILFLGAAGIGGLAFLKVPWIGSLSNQHTLSEYGIGRFVRTRSDNKSIPSRIVQQMLILMFLIYFIDSLGFLRMLKVPALMHSSWQSPVFSDRLFIAVVHVGGALIAGVLYSSLNERHLFYWIFGMFALTHLQYSLHLRTYGEGKVTLALPMMYALTVSLYTVINFSIWADLSTPKTIGMHSALGVASSAWTATFLSTGLAIFWQGRGMTLEQHIQIVDSLAMLAFLIMVLFAFFKKQEKLI
ncbi:MAG: hypothetical protein JW757_10075 [Anaerolineales bacterium]|nr:hypothetical protein [Anaerolineales bacterium]